RAWARDSTRQTPSAETGTSSLVFPSKVARPVVQGTEHGAPAQTTGNSSPPGARYWLWGAGFGRAGDEGDRGLSTNSERRRVRRDLGGQLDGPAPAQYPNACQSV